jgi:pyruvate formate lyase activating enzyme
MNGIIFSVKKYSIHDGPGIRVTFFMKGCPLSCRWCHNPEGISPEPEEIIQINRVGDREFSRKVTAGRSWTVDELIETVEKERVFIEQSGGGVTFSGGEPMMQSEFLVEALKACRQKGFHTAVDTSGYVKAATLKKVIPLTDMFLFDLKLYDREKHISYTGVSNELIFRNLGLIISSGCEIFIRIPVIPGINDDDANLSSVIGYLAKVKKDRISLINLLPYHKSGTAKYKRFGRENLMQGFEQPSAERMKELKKLFSETGIKVKIGG